MTNKPNKSGYDGRMHYKNKGTWARIRAAKLKATPACERCGTTHKLIVHHKHYRTFGHEQPEDLMTLCGPCHNNVHYLLDRGIVNLAPPIDVSSPQAFAASHYRKLPPELLQ